jgi:outer membrane receptor for ferrienterochelin and colicins
LDALWHHSETLSSRFAIGTGYRLPTSFFEQDHGILSANNVDRSAARPERSDNASYSLNYANDRFTATTSLNYTRITDMALFVNDSMNNFVLEPAQQPFTVASADAVGTWQATPGNAFTLGLEGYHYQFNPYDAYNAALFSRPEYRVHLSYDHESGPWDFNIRSTFTGPQDLAKWYDYADNPIYNLNGTPKPNWSPTFWVVDTHLLYAVNKWFSLNAGVNNVFNYQQAKHDSYLFQDPYGNLNVTYIWGPNIGRSFVAGVKVYFQ